MLHRLKRHWKIVLPTTIFAIVLILHVGCIRQAWTLHQLREAGYTIGVYQAGTPPPAGEVKLEVSTTIDELSDSGGMFADLYGTPAVVFLSEKFRKPKEVTQVDLTRLASLHARKISITGYSQVDDKFAEILSRSAETQEIALMGSGITHRGTGCLLSMPSVANLLIDSTNLDDDLNIEEAADAAPISLNLWNSSIGSRAVTQILAKREVVYLAIAWTKVTDDCAEAIANEPSLESIIVGGSPMSPKAVAVIAGNRNLRQLWLEKLPIDNKAAQSISKMPCLQSLLARKSDVSEANLTLILANPGLQEVRIQSPSISDEFIARIKSQYPQVHIVIGNQPSDW